MRGRLPGQEGTSPTSPISEPARTLGHRGGPESATSAKRRSTIITDADDIAAQATVTATAHVKITNKMLDRGTLTDTALRRIRYHLDGIPARARIEVRLGPLQQPDELLICYLASLPNPIRFGGDWRAVDSACRQLNALRSEATL